MPDMRQIARRPPNGDWREVQKMHDQADYVNIPIEADEVEGEETAKE
jgi:hypothetical protein